MDALISFLHANKRFQPAHKKTIKYKQVATFTDPTPKTFYIYQGKSVRITTLINGSEETSGIAKHGDYVITGPLREKYVVKSANVPKTYDMINGDRLPW